MIGNLFSSVSLALLSGVLAFGGAPQNNVDGLQIPVQAETSLLDSLSYNQIYVPSIEFDATEDFDNPFTAVLDYTYTKVYLYGYNKWEVSPLTYDGTYESLLSCLNNSDDYLCAVGVNAYLNGLPSNRAVVVEYQFATLNQSIVWGGKSYNVDGFEFYPYLICFDDSNNATSQISLGQYNVDEISIDADGVYGAVSSNVYGVADMPYNKFNNVLKSSVRFNLLPSTTTTFRLGFSGHWCCNYFNTLGYAQGYANGQTSGYAQGYTAGQSSQGGNTTFMGLFNSIADTPLRFIYGLFNFDLFGISCLVIVLTLLTGIMVFGIFKKVWK